LSQYLEKSPLNTLLIVTATPHPRYSSNGNNSESQEPEEVESRGEQSEDAPLLAFNCSLFVPDIVILITLPS